MNHNVYLYILVMAGVTYLIRLLPLTLIKKEIKNVCQVLSLLRPLRHPVRHDLSCHSPRHSLCVVRRSSPGSGCSSGLEGKSLFQVSLAACAMVFLLELFL